MPTCPAPACSAALAAGQSMCPRHWKLVPRIQQIEISRAAAACRSDKSELATIRSRVALDVAAKFVEMRLAGGAE